MADKGKDVLTPCTITHNVSQKQLRSLEPQNDIRLTIMQTVQAENLIKGLSAAAKFVKDLGEGEYDLLLEISKKDNSYDRD